MVNITTHFMGLKLPNPVMASASPMTSTVKSVMRLVDAGIGAVVLKSLFEEDIAASADQVGRTTGIMHPEAAMYSRQMSMLLQPDSYLAIVEECAEKMSIPLIASLNCHTKHWWIDYAERLAAVGADAIELNLSPMSVDPKTTSLMIENSLVEMVRLAREAVSVPLAVKLGSNFAALPHLVSRLEDAGANAVTLFNRFYKIDIDTQNLSFKSGQTLSCADEFAPVLRWTGILSDTCGLDLSASTGVYDAESLIKILLAGGQTVQLCTALYRNGLDVIDQILEGLQQWMGEREFECLDDFRSALSLFDDKSQAFYQRLQHVKALKGKA